MVQSLMFKNKSSQSTEPPTSETTNQANSPELAAQSSISTEKITQFQIAQKAQSQHQQTRPLIMFWVETFVAITVLALVSMVLFLILDQQQVQIATNQILETQVNTLAERLSQTLNFYQTTLKGLAADSTLIQIANQHDIKIKSAREQILTKIIPGALRVRLLPTGHELIDLTTETPLSYASLALLRLAEESTQSPPLEIHQTKSKQLYLVGVTALRDNAGQIQGLLHVMWNATVLYNEIKKMDSTYGQIALQQRVSDQPVTIFGATIVDSPFGTRKLAASQMQIIYWQSNNVFVPLFISSIWIIGILIVSFGLILGVQHWRLTRAVAVDQLVILSIVEDLLAERKPKLLSVAVRESADIVQSLLKMSKITKGSNAATRNQEKSAIDQVQSVAVALLAEVVEKPQTLSTQNANVIKEETVKKTDTSTVVPQNITAEQASPADVDIPKILFRNHDIRGIFNQTLTVEIAYELGRAIGSRLQQLNQKTINVARDARPSGAELSSALIEGLVATGRDVVNLGVTTAPVAYFSTHHFDNGACVFVGIGGRVPMEYNGFKILINNEIVIESDLLALRQLALEGPLHKGIGSHREQDILPAYMERIADDINIARPLKVVIDCGSGCASLVAPQLFRTLGCEVIELFCELDTSFPGHPPDPSRPENLKSLQTAVVSENADLGLAFDAEADRIGVVDSKGRIILPDRLLMVLATDVLGRNPGGDILFDVNCSRILANQILQNGGRPVMWQAGHAALKAKLHDTQALLAGDWSGHIIFEERWYGFDDACYAAARLMEILAVDPRSTAEFFNDFPISMSTPELSLKMQEGETHILIKLLQEQNELLTGARLVTVDGLRAEYEDGWGLVRASNTGPCLRFRFEADSESALERIQTTYRKLLAKVAPKLKLPF